MILETGRIVSIEPEGVWVETIRKSVCGSCKAEKGCGQKLLNQWDGHTSFIWVLLNGRNPNRYHLGDEVKLGVPENIIVKASLLIYLLPLAVMIAAIVVTHYLWQEELLTALNGFGGLLLGGILVRIISWRMRLNPDVQPVLVDDSVIVVDEEDVVDEGDFVDEDNSLVNRYAKS
jgi:sigma-E factor negative regulatory protein RseC